MLKIKFGNCAPGLQSMIEERRRLADLELTLRVRA